jgi:hypothetical protein
MCVQRSATPWATRLLGVACTSLAAKMDEYRTPTPTMTCAACPSAAWSCSCPPRSAGAWAPSVVAMAKGGEAVVLGKAGQWLTVQVVGGAKRRSYARWRREDRGE